jgi:hypothetical protein
VKVVGDSQLIIKQVNDEYKVKDDKLIPYKKLVETLKEYFVCITFEQIPRAQNRSADAMATVGSMLRIPPGNNDMPFFVENLRQPAYDMPESCLACEVVGPHSPWYEPIFTYLKDSTFPPEISRSEK